MAAILSHPNPRLADVQCSRLKFEPGDRVLVRVYREISKEQEKRLKQTVERWAGDQVEVLVINALEMSVDVESAKIVP